MPRVLNSITLNAPAAPVTADVTDTFAFTGTPGFSGSGGVNRYDFRWEVNSGGGFVPIAASGTGLITAGTNPLVNSNSTSANSITVTCDQTGTYSIRMVGAPATGGSYTVTSATQSVTVSAAAEEHSGSFAATGGGVAGIASSTDRLVDITATGGGVASVGVSTQRSGAFTATGGGVVTWDATRSEGAEDHAGSFTATGGGVAAIGVLTQRTAGVSATGAGIASVGAPTQRIGAFSATGGGVAAITGSGQESGSAVGHFAATGGGTVSFSVASARMGAAAMSGGGVLTAAPSTQRFGGFTASGGGVATFDAIEPPPIPVIARRVDRPTRRWTP